MRSERNYGHQAGVSELVFELNNGLLLRVVRSSNHLCEQYGHKLLIDTTGENIVQGTQACAPPKGLLGVKSSHPPQTDQLPFPAPTAPDPSDMPTPGGAGAFVEEETESGSGPRSAT